jgi:glycosyltransferase involved in cell wall biosynthesis
MTEAPDRAPRLIQLAEFERPLGGSFIGLVDGIAREAAARGWRPEAVFFEGARSTEWAAQLERAGVTMHFAPDELRGARARLARWLAGVLDQRPGPTVAHSHFIGFDVALAAAARSRPDLKVIWHVHTTASLGRYQYARAVIKHRVVGRSVDAIFCPAMNIVDEIVARGAPRDKVHFVPSAIEADDFAFADDARRRQARAALDLNADVPVLIHFGWEWRLKGGPLFVDTVAELVAGGLDSVVALERGGDERYLERGRERGVDGRIRLLEPVPESWMLHAAADVQVASSFTEGMAYGVLESLTIGTPVVATDIPGHAYLGEHIAACRIVPHDAAALAHAVREVLELGGAERERQAREGREWIVQNLSVARVGGQLVDIYDELLRGEPVTVPWS